MAVAAEARLPLNIEYKLANLFSEAGYAPVTPIGQAEPSGV